MDLQLHAAFPSCERAFDYLDSAQQGAIDCRDFRDGMMRVMSGSLPLSTEALGLQLVDIRGKDTTASVELDGARRGLGLRPASAAQRRYTPDTHNYVRILDPLQQEACSFACEKLFVSLTSTNAASGQLRFLRVLGYAQFERFWKTGEHALTSIDGQLVDGRKLHSGAAASWKSLGDFWAVELLAMVKARGDELAALTAACCGGERGLLGQVSARDLAEMVARLLCFRAGLRRALRVPGRGQLGTGRDAAPRRHLEHRVLAPGAAQAQLRRRLHHRRAARAGAGPGRAAPPHVDQRPRAAAPHHLAESH
jgi:hypothetical protein